MSVAVRRSRARRAAGVCACIAVAGCAGAEAERPGFEITDSAGVTLVRNPAELADSSRTPRLVPDLRIGVVDGPVEMQFSRITEVDEGPGGEIYVLDRESMNVRVFDRQGTYLRAIGRQGQGPGEFANPVAIRVGPGDTLHVAQNQTRSMRLQTFAPDGSLVRTATFPVPGSIGLEWAVTPRGDLLLEVSPAAGLPALLVRVDGVTTAMDTLAVLEPARPENTVIFAPTPHWAELADGRFAVGRSDEYRFVVFGADGGVERVVTREATPRPIPESAKEELLEARRASIDRLPPLPGMRERMLEGMTVEEHYPIKIDLMAGPRGTVWAQRYALPVDQGGDGILTFDVFDAEGGFLGPVRIAAGYPPPFLRGEHVYVVVRDDLAVPYLQRFRIEWGGGG